MVGRFRDRLRRAVRSYGFVGLVRRTIANRLPFSKHLVFRWQAAETGNEAGVEGLTIGRHRRIDEVADDVRLSYRLQPFALAAELWTGRIGGVLVGVCWSRSGQKRSDYFVELETSDAVIYSCHVQHEFRRRGIYSTMLRAIALTLCEEGTRRIYINCKSWNLSSVRGILKAGFEEIGTSWCLQLPGRTWHFRNGCREDRRRT